MSIEAHMWNSAYGLFSIQFGKGCTDSFKIHSKAKIFSPDFVFLVRQKNLLLSWNFH